MAFLKKIIWFAFFSAAVAGGAWGLSHWGVRWTLPWPVAGFNRGASEGDWVRGTEPKARAYSSFLKGLVRENRAEWPLATEAFRESSELDPKALLPRIHWGVSLAEEGQSQEARRVLEEVYLRSGRDSRVRAVTAMMFVSLGRYREAVAELEAVLADRPSDPWALLALADIHVLSERLEDAREVYRRLHELKLGTGTTLFNQAMIESRLERYREAETHLEEALKTGAMPVKGWMALGLVLEAQNKKEEAAAIYREALEAQPNDAQIQRNLARTLASLGRPAEAARTYGEAFKGYPADSSPAVQGASLYIQAGMFQEALALLDSALAAGHNEAEILFLKGYARDEAGDPKEAEIYYRFALQIDEDFADAHFYLAALLDERHQGEEARYHLRRTVQIDPWNAEAYNYLGYLDVEEGRDLRHAVSLIEKALEIEPENPAFLDSLGWAYFKQGLYEESLRHLERARDLGGADPTIQEHLLEVYRKAGTEGSQSSSSLPAGGATGEILSRGGAAPARGSGT